MLHFIQVDIFFKKYLTENVEKTISEPQNYKPTRYKLVFKHTDIYTVSNTDIYTVSNTDIYTVSNTDIYTVSTTDT